MKKRDIKKIWDWEKKINFLTFRKGAKRVADGGLTLGEGEGSIKVKLV